MDSWLSQLRKGVVELAVLAEVARGETYGYALVERLGRLQGLALTESTVYPVLARLARDGSLGVRLAPSPSGPARRYYRITPDGQARLRLQADGWATINRSLTTLLEGDS